MNDLSHLLCVALLVEHVKSFHYYKKRVIKLPYTRHNNNQANEYELMNTSSTTFFFSFWKIVIVLISFVQVVSVTSSASFKLLSLNFLINGYGK